jgi:hypothetical protein
MLVKVEEEQEEDIYLPDRRFESSKEGKTERGKYQQEAFKKCPGGDYMCPNGLKMKLKNTMDYDDGHKVFVYQGTGCEECPLKTKCCSGKVRTISIDFVNGYSGGCNFFTGECLFGKIVAGQLQFLLKNVHLNLGQLRPYDGILFLLF